MRLLQTNGVKTQPNPVVFFRLHDSTQKSSRKVSCQNPIFQEDFSMFYDSLDDVLTVTLSDEDQEGLGTVLGASGNATVATSQFQYVT